VGQDEEPFPAMGRADFRRAKESFRNAETQFFQLVPYHFIGVSSVRGSDVEESGDVFQKDD
jgi:hypothetical protein